MYPALWSMSTEELEKYMDEQEEKWEKEKAQLEPDDSIHVSHAEAYVLADKKFFPEGDKKVDIDQLQALVEKLRKTDYFGDVDESFFIDDCSAPPRYTEEYRQWCEYHEVKGNYNLLGNSPSPYE